MSGFHLLDNSHCLGKYVFAFSKVLGNSESVCFSYPPSKS